MDGIGDGAEQAEQASAPSADELFTVRVIDVARDLETLLVARGATGRGLHEKISSVVGRLPDGIERQLRFIATVRNRLLHEGGFRVPGRDQARFIESAKTARTALEGLSNPAAQFAVPSFIEPAVTLRPVLERTPRPAPERMPKPAPRVAELSVQRPAARQGSGGLMQLLIVAILLLLLGGAAVPAWHWVTAAVGSLVAAMEASRSGAP